MSTCKEVVLTLRLTFEGSYYEAGELVDVSDGWIRSGLEDRDDLTGVEISGTVVSETEIKEDNG
jgi:hypothetical protein